MWSNFSALEHEVSRLGNSFMELLEVIDINVVRDLSIEILTVIIDFLKATQLGVVTDLYKTTDQALRAIYSDIRSEPDFVRYGKNSYSKGLCQEDEIIKVAKADMIFSLILMALTS